MKLGEPEARGMPREAGSAARTSGQETGGPESREGAREQERESERARERERERESRSSSTEISRAAAMCRAFVRHDDTAPSEMAHAGSHGALMLL